MTVRVVVTPQIGRFLDCPPADVEARDVRGALEAVFDRTPRLRTYLIDDAGRLRRHVRLFVDGDGSAGLDRPVADGAEIYVMQSLTGG